MSADPAAAKAVFLEALGVGDPAARAALVGERCGGDAALHARVNALLAASDRALGDDGTRSFSDAAPTADPDGTRDRPGPAEAAGQVIAGRYKLLERIGEGGMGEVWMAEQTEPVKRRVAVKLIRAERGTSKTILARFEAERQAIALMDHPHIARLLDAGTTEAGAPFFAMELVKGVPLTDFCDRHRLTVPDRLGLFAQICSAVQHAHQKGIIHRDLKPSNVLVESHDGKAVPKVIDFGLAKATTGLQLTEYTLFTGFGSVLGTPTYMAPEQAAFNAVDVDTRADVYALGVILYELLTGTTPLTRDTVRKAALEEVLRLVREQEPPAPSSRVSTSEAAPSVAANRQTEPAKLGRLVRGELDWIALKALSKERERRYESAAALAADVGRFLNHEPVAAGPPSRWYRVRKFVRRHRGPVTAAGLMLVALVLGIGGTTFGLVRAEDRRREAEEAKVREGERADGEAAAKLAERKAQQEANDKRVAAEVAVAAEQAARAKEVEERKYAQAIAAFVKDDFLALTSVEGQERFGGDGLDRKATLLDLLNRAAEKLKARKDLDPRIEAELCWIVGVNYRGVGEASKGVPFLERALQLRLNSLGRDHPDTVNAMNSLGAVYSAAGQQDRALPLLEEAYERRKARLGRDHPDTLASMDNLANLFLAIGRSDKALPLAEEAYERTKAKLGPDHPRTLAAMGTLAQVAGSTLLAEDAFKIAKAKFGPDHPGTLTSLNNLAVGLLNAGRSDKALPLAEEAYDRTKAKLGPGHPDTLTSMGNLGVCYHALGKSDRAVPLLEEALELSRARLGPHHPISVTSMSKLGVIYLAAGQADKALSLNHEAYTLLKARPGPDHPETLAVMNNLAESYRSLQQLDKSMPLLEELLLHKRRKLGRSHPDTLRTAGNLGADYRDAGRLTEAIPLLEEAYRGSKKEPALRFAGVELLEAYSRGGKPDETRKLLDELLADARRTLPENSSQLAGQLAQCGRALLVTKAFAEAEPLLRECLTIREAREPDAWTTSNTLSQLGGALLGQKRYADAEPLLLKGYEGMKARETDIPKLGGGQLRIPEALDRLVELYTATNKPDQLKKYQELRAKCPTLKETLPPPRKDK